MILLTFVTGSSVILKLYANDAKLYSCIQFVHDVQYLQLGLDFIFNLYLAWQLSTSVSKCTVLQLRRSLGTGSYKLIILVYQWCCKTRDVSILIDCEMNFNEHIYNITASANYHAFLIKKCFLSKDPSSLVKAFKVYVRSLVEYCSPVWSPFNTGLITKLSLVAMATS